MIGLAKEHEGLYYLEANEGSVVPISSSNIVTVHSLGSSSLPQSTFWHLRLGHLSNNRMHLLHDKYSFIPDPIHIACDIYHMSKQKKLTFGMSNSNVENPFDLTHMNI